MHNFFFVKVHRDINDRDRSMENDSERDSDWDNDSDRD